MVKLYRECLPFSLLCCPNSALHGCYSYQSLSQQPGIDPLILRSGCCPCGVFMFSLWPCWFGLDAPDSFQIPFVALADAAVGGPTSAGWARASSVVCGIALGQFDLYFGDPSGHLTLKLKKEELHIPFGQAEIWKLQDGVGMHNNLGFGENLLTSCIVWLDRTTRRTSTGNPPIQKQVKIHLINHCLKGLQK